MLIQCEKCSTRYNLDEAKIPGKGAKVTCPTCKHVFIVMKGATPGAPATTAPVGGPPAAAATPPQAPPANKSLLDNFFDDSKTVPGQSPFGTPNAAPAASLAGGRTIRSWKVRVASGLVYDFTDGATLKTWIAERKVTTADQISADGATWTVIGTIANLDAFFGGPSTPSMGAPGPAPATGFGPAPANAPAAPAFAGARANSSLADLFNAPAPGASSGDGDPFATNVSPAPSSGNPFGPPTSAPTGNPFGGAPLTPLPAAAPTNPSGNPFGGASADPFGPGAADPFAAPSSSATASPAAPAFGADPFAAPAAPAGGGPFGDPFGAAPDAGTAAPFEAPPPPQFGPKPAPPPWLAGPAPLPTPAAPAPPAAVGGPPPPFATGSVAAPAGGPPPKPASWSAAGDVTAMPAPIPAKGTRKIGKMIGLAAAGAVVLAVGGGLAMNAGRLQAMFRPIPTPMETPAPPPLVLTLEGEARDHYLKARRLLRLDTPDSYKQAETEFRAALAKANGNPRAAAGVLESLALQKQAGVAVPDDALQMAQAAAGAALKEDAQGLETNRALAQLDAVSGRTADAIGRLDTALAAHPGDPEALFLRSKLRAADPAQAAAAAEDLTTAAADTTLTRAVLAKAEGATPKSPEKKAADELAAANAATLAAIGGGTWSWTPEEFPRLLPGVPVPTPATAATATPVESAVAVASATPTTTATATAVEPTPAKTPIASASATKTPLAAVSPKPTKTPLGAGTPKPTRTPLATGTADATPTPNATTDGTQVATATASDHFMAGQAYEQAASWDDAIAEYSQAVKLSSKTGSYRLALGTAQFRAGKLQDAATTLTDLLEREPNNASAHRMLGLLFEATGQNANACGEFQEYLRIKPQAPDAGDIRARLVRNGC